MIPHLVREEGIHDFAFKYDQNQTHHCEQLGNHKSSGIRPAVFSARAGGVCFSAYLFLRYGGFCYFFGHDLSVIIILHSVVNLPLLNLNTLPRYYIISQLKVKEDFCAAKGLVFP